MILIFVACQPQKILNLIPKESDGERFEDAVARVCRCVGGGADTENADSDSDLEVVSDSIPVNLRCPVSNTLFLFLPIFYCFKLTANIFYSI